MPRDDETRPATRWSERPPADPHRDVTGALHDVSNALTVLLGWVAEARESARSSRAERDESADSDASAGTGSPARVQHALAIVEQHARAARDLARRVLGADAGPGAGAEEREEPLDRVVGDVVEALSVEAQRAGVSLEVTSRAPGALVPVPGDLRQILTNVVLNAIAWSPRGARVKIESRAGDVAEVFVEDEGPGVPAAQAPFLFDGASSRQGGAGVGLRHARAVARAAGGELELAGAGQGTRTGGARFRLRWPRAEQTFPRAPVSSPRPAALAGTRILVVEDDADVATLLESALGARGARVVVARSAAEVATRAAETHDVALVDLSPIAQDVRGAVDALRRGSPGLAVVFISGSAVGLPEGLDDERTRWVRKPFEVGEIVSVLAETRAASAGK